MKKLVTMMALALLASAGGVQAGELDNEGQVKNAQRFAADLPQTVVVKKDNDGTVSVFHSASLIPAGTQSIDDANFVKMASNSKIRGELDGDSSSGNWFFYWNYNNYSYPTFNYWGYNYYYQPYYNYYNGWSNYSYYRWYW